MTTILECIGTKFSLDSFPKFEVVQHPVHGGIVFLSATQTILPGQELTVNYNYDLDSLGGEEHWYRDLYYQTYPEERDNEEDGEEQVEDGEEAVDDENWVEDDYTKDIAKAEI